MKDILKRLLFVIMIPIFIFEIIIGTIMITPFWVITNKHFYDSKYHQGFVDWVFGLID